MGLIEDLGEGPVGLDTVTFIYLIEEHPRFLTAVREIFAEIDRGRIAAVTSALTLLELLVLPYRAGNAELVNRYEGLLTRSRGLRLIEIDRSQLRAAAQIRAHYPVRTPDALQLAAALSGRCKVFVTNDQSLPLLSGLQTLQLNDYVSDAE